VVAATNNGTRKSKSKQTPGALVRELALTLAVVAVGGYKKANLFKGKQAAKEGWNERTNVVPISMVDL
jgi:hypothetical protein